MHNKKLKLILDGTVLGMAIDNKLARTGIYFVIKNLCDSLLLREDVELKIISSLEFKEKLINFYKGHKYEQCLNIKDLKFGEEKLNIIMPFHTANEDLFKIKNTKIIQIIYDFAVHFCPELKNNNIDFEKNILNSLNSESYALCISKKTKIDLLSISQIIPEKVGVFYPGLRNDLDNLKNFDFNVKNFLNIPKESEYILSLSTLEPRKNLKATLQTFEATIKKLKSKNLYLVLTGAQGWVDTKKFLNDLSPATKKKIIFTGYVQDKYIKELYKSSLCFMYPSFYEGFGLPPLEAMACGTPVIISDRGSLPEVFGETVDTFDPYDLNGMSKCIIDWYQNPKKRLAEIERLKKFSKTFTWERSAQQLISFIKKINYL